ncbi:unnamed protein product [Allacma fusca]|uniref:Uncharacterized protein n=1 Tax=Allacma fusca TaxID=39272 RepID=A0A8J2LU67_9HEXA|nr:unnamed protein product [Allacma fusca]
MPGAQTILSPNQVYIDVKLTTVETEYNLWMLTGVVLTWKVKSGCYTSLNPEIFLHKSQPMAPKIPAASQHHLRFNLDGPNVLRLISRQTAIRECSLMMSLFSLNFETQ